MKVNQVFLFCQASLLYTVDHQLLSNEHNPGLLPLDQSSLFCFVAYFEISFNNQLIIKVKQI